MHKLDGEAMAAAVEAPLIAYSGTRKVAPRVEPLAIEALDLIAATMTSAFGTRWTSAHGDNFAETSGRIWAIDLAGLSVEAIERGLELARQLDWPPVLAEFKAMCLGVLPIATVIAERAGDPREQSPFTVLVGRNLAEYEWRMADPQRRERMLEQAWQRAKQHVFDGGAMPTYTPAAQQLTVQDEQPPVPPIMVTAHEAIAACRRELGLRDPAAEPAPEPAPAPRTPLDCVRCNGTRKDPDPNLRAPGTIPGECVACYGSGVEHAYNRVVHEDGSIEERL